MQKKGSKVMMELRAEWLMLNFNSWMEVREGWRAGGCVDVDGIFILLY